MRSTHIGIWRVVCAAIALAGTSVALADGVCNKGYRATTAAERATMTAVLETVKKALPPAPAGWVILGDDQTVATQNLCMDAELSPWNYDFNRSYQRTDDQEARQKTFNAAAAKVAAAMKLKQPRLDAIMARMTKLAEQQGALIQKGNMAAATALNQDIANAQDEYKKIADEGDSEAQMEAASAEASRDLQFHVGLSINAGLSSMSTDAREFPLPPGARVAFRWSTTSSGLKTDHAQILLGLWRPNGTGRWRSMSGANRAMTVAHTMLIDVSADPGRFESTIAAIDFSALAKLLPK